MEFYTSNCRRLDLKDLMEDARAKKRIVLSTSGGKYVVPDNLPQWSPIHEVLRNHYTAVIDIIRVSHKGHDVGDRVKFVVESIRPGRDPDILLIHYDDAGRRIWADVAPSAESLKSRDSLQIFLKEQVLLGKIPECVFFVYDMDQWRSSNRTRYGSERVPLGNVGFFEYYLWGRLHTVLFNRKLRAQNRRSLSASNEDQNKKNTDSELPEIG